MPASPSQTGKPLILRGSRSACLTLTFVQCYLHSSSAMIRLGQVRFSQKVETSWVQLNEVRLRDVNLGKVMSAKVGLVYVLSG